MLNSPARVILSYIEKMSFQGRLDESVQVLIIVHDRAFHGVDVTET